MKPFTQRLEKAKLSVPQQLLLECMLAEGVPPDEALDIAMLSEKGVTGNLVTTNNVNVALHAIEPSASI
jgi:hypothetical protein